VGDTSTYNDGRRVNFTLGNVTNTSLTNVRTLTIVYEAIVLDIPSNVRGAPSLDNRVTWSWLGGTLSASASPVEIREPKLGIAKTVDPTIAAIGSTVTFTISIAHTPESSMDAFDVIVTDVLPEGLTLVPGTINFTGLPADISDFDPVTKTLRFTWFTFGLTQSSTITFQATFIGPAPVTNSANVEWTSLPIDPQPSGLPVLLSTFNNFATERWYDPADQTGINGYNGASSIVLNAPGSGKALPRTGFAPGVITELPSMPADFAYAQTDVWVEIPKLNQKLTLVGVPFNNETLEWDLRWLGKDAGWLENTAFPTYSGNSAVTAHSTLPNGKDGPFAKLDTLSYGDQIIIHIGGQQYIYEVRTKQQVSPNAVNSVLKHEELPWLTLITCKSYNEKTGEYNYRSVVRAVLIKVEDK
jgi:LPXTG-site transpeptidase (sortase) family protein